MLGAARARPKLIPRVIFRRRYGPKGNVVWHRPPLWWRPRTRAFGNARSVALASQCAPTVCGAFIGSPDPMGARFSEALDW